jgi:hypothetical protein
MNEEKSTPRISELIGATTDALLKLKYHPDSLRHYQTVWNKFVAYAHTKNIESYSVGLSEAFLKDAYGIEPGTQLAHKDNVKARAVQLLTNVYLNQAIQLRRKYHEFHLPDSFKALPRAHSL